MSFLSLVTYTHVGFGLSSVLATCLIGIFSETRIFEITNPKRWHENFSVKSFSNSINVINVVLLYLHLTDLAAVHQKQRNVLHFVMYSILDCLD